MCCLSPSSLSTSCHPPCLVTPYLPSCVEQRYHLSTPYVHRGHHSPSSSLVRPSFPRGPLHTARRSGTRPTHLLRSHLFRSHLFRSYFSPTHRQSLAPLVRSLTARPKQSFPPQTADIVIHSMRYVQSSSTKDSERSTKGFYQV